MPHQVTKIDTMMSASGIKPWHYEETRDRVNVITGNLSGLEVLNASGLNWENQQRTMGYQDAAGEWHPIDMYVGNVRSTDGAFIDVASPDYRAIHNAEMVAFTDALMGEGMIAETAGSLDGLAIAWILFRMPEDVLVAGMDSERMNRYLLISLGHAPKRRPQAFRAQPTLVRVVCNNTWTRAQGEQYGRYTIATHMGNVGDRIEEAKKLLGLSMKAEDDLIKVAEQLVQVRYSEEQLASFKDRLFPAHTTGHKELDEARRKHALNRRASYLEYLVRTPDLEPIRDTFYGLVQAATGFQMHQQRYGSGSSKFETVFGLKTAENTGARATTLATKMAGLSSKAAADIESVLATV